MTQALVDPRVLARLWNFFPSTCTLQGPVETQSDSGQVTVTYADADGLVGLSCAVGRQTGSERRGERRTVISNNPVILLKGDYPAILPTWRVVADGQAYNITAVNHDSQHTLTELICEVVSV